MSSFRTERWLPASTFGRLLLLFVATLAATLGIAGWTLRTVSIEPGGEQMADLIAGQLVAARALARQPTIAGSDEQRTLLDIAWSDAAPSTAHATRLPFLNRLAQRLVERLGPGTEVLIEDGQPSRLWLQPAGTGDWIGLAVPHFALQAAWLVLVTAASGLAMVLVAAALFARSLTRPLVRLARAAPQLAQGEVPDGRLGHEGPREVRQLAAALVDAAAGVRAAARDRELLLAGLSHDLRTPLARLRLSLELLHGDEALRAGMVDDLEELDGIVGQFIDYARDGREEARQRIDVAALARELARQTWPAPVLHGPDHLLLDVRPLALRRALLNLLRNALRHGAAPFELALAVDARQLAIAIRDCGAGVPDAQLAALAEPFVRGADANTPGTGLGLAVAARVAALHGGRLDWRNRVGGGFEVVLSLPLSGDNGGAEPPTAEGAPS